MRQLEEVGIGVCQSFGVTVRRRRESAAHVGLWWNDYKVISMGVRLSSWITSFGFAINVSGDYSPSRYIRPCGIEGVRLISLQEIVGEALSHTVVTESVKKNFSSVFGRSLQSMPGEFLTEIQSLAEVSDTAMAG
jgi:lipoate-protein ligase B